MNRRSVGCLALLTFIFAACSVFFPTAEKDGFIRVRGTHFVHNDRPYYYAGANLWYGCYLGSPGETGDRPRLLRELDTLVANGHTNLRILAASEQSYIRRSVRPAIERAPGDLNDSLLQGLDFLLAEMTKRGMHAVLYLNNYWEWTGGMAQYVVWADGGRGVEPEDSAAGGFGAFMNFSASFYKNARANALYREYIRTIVKRRNTCNGRMYTEDPTIMAWQLANEPRPGTNSPEGERNIESLAAWIDQTAAYIHGLDTNHLVSSGSEGSVAFRWSDEIFLRTHASTHIDYLTFHLWAKNWGWFDPMKFIETLPSAEENAERYIDEQLALARTLGRPIVLEEFGLARDSARCGPGTPTRARDRYYERILSGLYDSAQAGSPFAGSNFWGWGGEARGRNADDVWRTGDPFVADPPQEPQGLNSVFVGDASTIHILRDHAFRMIRLGVIDTLRFSANP